MSCANMATQIVLAILQVQNPAALRPVRTGVRIWPMSGWSHHPPRPDPPPCSLTNAPSPLPPIAQPKSLCWPAQASTKVSCAGLCAGSASFQVAAQRALYSQHKGHVTAQGGRSVLPRASWNMAGQDTGVVYRSSIHNEVLSQALFSCNDKESSWIGTSKWLTGAYL